MPKFAVFIVIIAPIITICITFTILIAVKLITTQLLKKKGYRPNMSQVAYQQIQTDLNQVAADLTDIRLQLDDVGPHLKEMEFLKYAHQNDKA